MLLSHADDDAVACIDFHRTAREAIGVERVDGVGRRAAIGCQYLFGDGVAEGCASGASYSDALTHQVERNVTDSIAAQHACGLKQQCRKYACSLKICQKVIL